VTTLRATTAPEEILDDDLPSGMIRTRDAGHFTVLARGVPPVEVDTSAIEFATPHALQSFAGSLLALLFGRII
jgi:hypothetical protein